MSVGEGKCLQILALLIFYYPSAHPPYFPVMKPIIIAKSKVPLRICVAQTQFWFGTVAVKLRLNVLVATNLDRLP